MILSVANPIAVPVVQTIGITHTTWWTRTNVNGPRTSLVETVIKSLMIATVLQGTKLVVYILKVFGTYSRLFSSTQVITGKKGDGQTALC